MTSSGAGHDVVSYEGPRAFPPIVPDDLGPVRDGAEDKPNDILSASGNDAGPRSGCHSATLALTVAACQSGSNAPRQQRAERTIGLLGPGCAGCGRRCTGGSLRRVWVKDYARLYACCGEAAPNGWHLHPGWQARRWLRRLTECPVPSLSGGRQVTSPRRCLLDDFPASDSPFRPKMPDSAAPEAAPCRGQTETYPWGSRTYLVAAPASNSAYPRGASSKPIRVALTASAMCTLS